MAGCPPGRGRQAPDCPGVGREDTGRGLGGPPAPRAHSTLQTVRGRGPEASAAPEGRSGRGHSSPGRPAARVRLDPRLSVTAFSELGRSTCSESSPRSVWGSGRHRGGASTGQCVPRCSQRRGTRRPVNGLSPTRRTRVGGCHQAPGVCAFLTLPPPTPDLAAHCPSPRALRVAAARGAAPCPPALLLSDGPAPPRRGWRPPPPLPWGLPVAQGGDLRPAPLSARAGVRPRPGPPCPWASRRARRVHHARMSRARPRRHTRPGAEGPDRGAAPPPPLQGRRRATAPDAALQNVCPVLLQCQGHHPKQGHLEAVSASGRPRGLNLAPRPWTGSWDRRRELGKKERTGGA